MKKLSLYAVIISIFLTLQLAWNIHIAETTMECFYAIALHIACNVGLWCAYYFARDYESIKANESYYARLRAMTEKPYREE